MTKKRVSIFIFALQGGGAERVVSIILNQLNGTFDFYLVLMENTIKYNIPQNIPIFFISKSGKNENKYLKILKLPLFAFRYYKFIKKEKIEVSFSFLYVPNLINVLAKRLFRLKSKVILSERSNILFQPKPIKFLVKYLYKYSDIVIPNSIGSERTLVSQFSVNPNKIKTINNPIIINQIKGTNSKKNIFTFISVGRLIDVKNFELLIRAFSKIKSKIKTELIIVGDGKEELNLKNLVKKENIGDKVIFSGFVNNISDFYRRSDCFVLTSRYEGFPNVILEALSYGLPVISTDCKFGPREILSDSNFSILTDVSGVKEEKYGILVENENVEALKQSMELIIKNDELRLKYKRISPLRANEFRLEKILPQFEELINKV